MMVADGSPGDYFCRNAGNSPLEYRLENQYSRCL